MGWKRGRCCLARWPRLSSAKTSGDELKLEVWRVSAQSASGVSAGFFFISSGRETVVPVKHLHNSHPCESVPACGIKGGGSKLNRGEGKKECTEISSCDFRCFSSLFFF